MNYDDYHAGVEQFRATGSLVVQPQMIVPVIAACELLWVPAPPALPDLVAIVDPGTRLTTVDMEVHMRAIELERLELEPLPLPEWYHPAMNSPVMRTAYRSAERFFAEAEQAIAAIEEDLSGGWLERFGGWLERRQAVPNLGQYTPADDDLVATLLDLARAGDAETFRELALMRGVPAAEIPTMWSGTVKRVGK